MLELIIYNAIKNKIQHSSKPQVKEVMSEYMTDFCNQFSLKRLQDLDLTKPDIETLVFYLMYQIEELKHYHNNAVNNIQRELTEQRIDNILTSRDIETVCNKYKEEM